VLVPAARSLVEDLPTPPLVKMLKHSLPELPVRPKVDPSRRCPKHIHAALDAAVQERNAIVHRGANPTTYLWTALSTIREFLYLLDFYEGHSWAKRQLSEATLMHLGLHGTGAAN